MHRPYICIITNTLLKYNCATDLNLQIAAVLHPNIMHNYRWVKYYRATYHVCGKHEQSAVKMCLYVAATVTIEMLVNINH